MRCKDCSPVHGYPYKRSHLVALRPTKILALDPPSTWWPGGALCFSTAERWMNTFLRHRHRVG